MIWDLHKSLKLQVGEADNHLAANQRQTEYACCLQGMYSTLRSTEGLT